MTNEELIEHLEHTIHVLEEYCYKYETALKLIVTTPKYEHILSGDNPYWESESLLDGHDQAVEIAKRALEEGK